MAFDSQIGYADVTLTAPPPSSKLSSFIGYVDITLTGPPGPFASSLVGFVDVTLTAPPTPVRPIMVKNQGAWESAMVSVYDATTDTWR